MRLRALVLLVAVVVFGLAPFITPPFRGYDPGLFPVAIARPAIQPAGWAFSIWSVIYLWLIAHAGFGLWQRAGDAVWDLVRLPLAAACVIGAGWLSIAGVAPIAATVVIWVMAGAAIAAFRQADDGHDRWLLAGPAGILAGWLTAAAPVSTGVVLAGYGVLSNQGAALAMLGLALGLGLAVTRARAMPSYPAALAWGLFGIAMVNRAEFPLVAGAAALGILALAVAAFWPRRRAGSSAA